MLLIIILDCFHNYQLFQVIIIIHFKKYFLNLNFIINHQFIYLKLNYYFENP
jgi:hypothetical protein